MYGEALGGISRNLSRTCPIYSFHKSDLTHYSKEIRNDIYHTVIFIIYFKCHLFNQNWRGNGGGIVKAALAEFDRVFCFATWTDVGLSLCAIQNGSLDTKERHTQTQATWTTRSNLALTWKPDVCALKLSLYCCGQTHKCVWPQEECVSLIIG